MYLKKYISLIRKDGYIPFMPLGPIPTDRAIGWDHVSSAIGASHMAFEGGADIINSVTREEHTGGIPSLNSIYEAKCVEYLEDGDTLYVVAR